MATRMQQSDSDVLVEDLEKLLAIDENALEEGLQQQPEAYYRISKALALEASRRDALKQYLKEAEASAYLHYKGEAKDKGEKLSEKEVEAMVRTDEDVQAVVDKLLAKEKLVAKLTALEESFRRRGYALTDLVGLHLRAYYSDSTGDSALRERQHMEVRRRQARMRDDRRRGRT